VSGLSSPSMFRRTRSTPRSRLTGKRGPAWRLPNELLTWWNGRYEADPTTDTLKERSGKTAGSCPGPCDQALPGSGLGWLVELSQSRMLWRAMVHSLPQWMTYSDHNPGNRKGR
jgi:hypothetical protein